MYETLCSRTKFFEAKHDAADSAATRGEGANRKEKERSYEPQGERNDERDHPRRMVSAYTIEYFVVRNRAHPLVAPAGGIV